MNRSTYKPPYKRHQEYYTAEKVPADNSKGFKIRYVYTGPMYSFCRGEESYKKFKILSPVLCGICVAVFLITGLIYAPINAYRWTSLCVGLSFAAMVFMIVGEITLLASKYTSPKPDVSSMKIIMTLSSLLASLFLIGTLVTGIIFCIANVFSTSSLIILFMYLISLIIAVIKFILAGKVEWQIAA